MKTAMEKLIEELDLSKIANKNKLIMVKYIIAVCLEEEKEQILKAHINGQSEFDMLEYRDINKTLSENYYKKNYAK
jgi:hypothetical protein